MTSNLQNVQNINPAILNFDTSKLEKLGDGQNWYEYVNSNPIRNIDADGLEVLAVAESYSYNENKRLLLGGVSFIAYTDWSDALYSFEKIRENGFNVDKDIMDSNKQSTRSSISCAISDSH